MVKKIQLILCHSLCIKLLLGWSGNTPDLWLQMKQLPSKERETLLAGLTRYALNEWKTIVEAQRAHAKY